MENLEVKKLSLDIIYIITHALTEKLSPRFVSPPSPTNSRKEQRKLYYITSYLL